MQKVTSPIQGPEEKLNDWWLLFSENNCREHMIPWILKDSPSVGKIPYLVLYDRADDTTRMCHFY